jgi:tripartite-type tricarboxylate transporter receptor subunit TctC
VEETMVHGKMPGRRAVLAAAAASAVFAGAGALAQAWPAKPLRFVVPFAPGGSSDVMARLTGQHIAERLGRPVVVENKPGAASVIGTAEVARAAPDGHTMLLTPPPFVITQFANPNLPYDPERDLRPVVLLATSPTMLFARTGLVAGGFAEFLALARARPGSLTYGSPGIGSMPHVAFELLKLRTGIDVLHVPYRGGGPAAADVAAGRIDLMIASPIDMAAHLQAGTVVPIAGGSAARVRAFPDLPTLQELGLADFDASGWSGVMVPGGTPEPIVERLNREFNAVLELAAVRERLATLGAEPVGGTAAAFQDWLTAERARWREAVAAARITLQ